MQFMRCLCNKEDHTGKRIWMYGRPYISQYDHAQKKKRFVNCRMNHVSESQTKLRWKQICSLYRTRITHNFSTMPFRNDGSLCTGKNIITSFCLVCVCRLITFWTCLRNGCDGVTVTSKSIILCYRLKLCAHNQVNRFKYRVHNLFAQISGQI